VSPKPNSPLVERSQVPAGLPYNGYKKYLRRDFFFSCAYCTMSEAEAQAIRFTIDHYEPRKSRPDLENAYDNLMYACDECNIRKSDRCPPPAARGDGFRFFRPDQDSRDQHFLRVGVRLRPESPVGHYSIEALDLNRASLRRLRELRERLTQSAKLASDGVLGLRRLRMDQLPPAIRGRAVAAVQKAAATQEQIANDIDALLSAFARSALIDDNMDSESESSERIDKLKALESLYGGSWRAPRKQRR
jgi:hypothetical protein